MVYGIIGMINFAHGDIYMIGAYVGFVTLSASGTNSGPPLPLIVLVMIIIAVAVTGVYGYATEQLAYLPVRQSPRLVPLISAISLSIFLAKWVEIEQGASALDRKTAV